jgi:Domain of unknown function (DUF222)
VALSRGVVAGSDCPTATAWVIQWAPSFRAGGAAQLVTVAHATMAVRNAGLAAAVLGARVGVRNAAVALVEMDKLRPRLRDEAIEAVWEGFLQIATDHGPTEIRRLRDKLIATYGQQEEFQRRHDQLKHGASLSQPLDDDGMAEYRLRLDPEGKEVLKAMLGPHPNQPRRVRTCAPATSAAVRHWSRSAGGRPPPEAQPPRASKAALFVTINWQDLQTRSGAGSSMLTGQLLAPETIRRIACDATIIPVVLGTNSEILDVGRARRLFTPGILRALWLRDKGCTIPGCTAPPFWADAHHIIHWIDGGETSLLNGALLCGRHHTIAHQRGWTATATTSEVTWHF